MGKIIECAFNLFKEGRKYTGHHRNYILESAIKTCYAPQTREKMGLREAVGYLGHGRRELARKLSLSEVEAIKLPDGSTILTENIPSNVTVAFEVAKDGTVTHSQEILETAPGRVVDGLNSSRVGGFSWACGGFDGGVGGGTKVTDFHGFDYVMNPGFSANRGYILESAGDADFVLESVAKITGMPEKEAEKWLRHWVSSSILENALLKENTMDIAAEADALAEELEEQGRLLESANSRIISMESTAARRKAVILEAAQKSVVVVPEEVLQAMMGLADENDFGKVVSFFENARRVNTSTLPLGGKEEKPRVDKGVATRTAPEYGTAAYADTLTEKF